jgi:hypothetical protein
MALCGETRLRRSEAQLEKAEDQQNRYDVQARHSRAYSPSAATSS